MKRHFAFFSKYQLVILYFFIMLCNGFLINSFAQDRIEINSSPNPVGSGARALGMGGAFIAVADDATAASWNPGGLIQLDFPEISFVGEGFHRIEDNSFGTNPEGNGPDSVSEVQLNYFSIAYPFTLWERNMILSLNRQHLYDFTRKWDFSLNLESGKTSVDYEQDGGLTALGIAYCIQLNLNLSFGFTLNFWDNNIGKNEWEQKAVIHRSNPERESTQLDHYLFKGVNANFGLMWQSLNQKITIGAVFKTQFNADLTHDYSLYGNNNFLIDNEDGKQGTLTMPMSYGIGIAYRHSDNLTVAADVYRTEWDDFVIDMGSELSVTGLPIDKSDVDPTCQIHIGAEYLYTKWKYMTAFRLGVFYDPAPAEGSPDDFWGFSTGAGIVFDHLFNDKKCLKAVIFDFAYQYRFGNDVGKYIMSDLKFSQDIEEHRVYASVILHLDF